jgi:hypothetical protein
MEERITNAMIGRSLINRGHLVTDPFGDTLYVDNGTTYYINNDGKRIDHQPDYYLDKGILSGEWLKKRVNITRIDDIMIVGITGTAIEFSLLIHDDEDGLSVQKLLMENESSIYFYGHAWEELDSMIISSLNKGSE